MASTQTVCTLIRWLSKEVYCIFVDICCSCLFLSQPSRCDTNSFNVFPLKVAPKLWVVDYFFSRQLLLNASNAHQAPLNGNTNPSHATANQPKQSGRWAGQIIARLATSISPPLCLVAWYSLSPFISRLGTSGHDKTNN